MDSLAIFFHSLQGVEALCIINGPASGQRLRAAGEWKHRFAGLNDAHAHGG